MRRSPTAGSGWSAVFAASTIRPAGTTIRFGMIRCSRSVAETATSARQKNARDRRVEPLRPNFQTQPATRSAVTSSTAG